MRAQTISFGGRISALFGCCLFGLASGTGCPGPDIGPDGGFSDSGADEDGGLPDGSDPQDAGCDDPSCLSCMAGGTLCSDGGVCRDGGCVETCQPGSSGCVGPRQRDCGDGGTWAPPISCGLGGLCVGESCAAVSTCSSDTPPCCAQGSDCGNMAELYTCSECRPTVRTVACFSGACETLPPSIDFTVLGDAGGLPDPTRVASGVVTIYRSTTADGRVADCATLLDDSSGATPHDERDPQLNPTVSRPYEFTGGTGTDFFTTLILGAPGGGEQTIVLSVFDGNRGGGLRLGRGCVDHLTPTSGQTLSLSLLP